MRNTLSGVQENDIPDKFKRLVTLSSVLSLTFYSEQNRKLCANNPGPGQTRNEAVGSGSTLFAIQTAYD